MVPSEPFFVGKRGAIQGRSPKVWDHQEGTGCPKKAHEGLLGLMRAYSSFRSQLGLQRVGACQSPSKNQATPEKMESCTSGK